MEYTSNKDQYHPLKRRFWVHSIDSDTYIQSIQFFDDSIKDADDGKFIRIDHNFFNNIKKCNFYNNIE